MTPAASNDKMVLSLLAAAKKQPLPPQPEAVEYDWDVPGSLTPSQLEQLKQFASSLADALSEALSMQLHDEIQLSLDNAGMHYARKLDLGQGEAGNCCIPLVRGSGGGECGLVVVPAELASGWVAKALGGDSASSGEQREFSSLESALLLNIVAAVVARLSEKLQAAGAPAIKCGLQVSTDVQLSGAQPEDECCVFGFRMGEGDGPADITFILSGDIAASIAGETQASASMSAADILKNLRAAIEQGTVAAKVTLGEAILTMRDVMGLEEGDILLLDTRPGEPVLLSLSGQPAFAGLLATCEGSYALTITHVLETPIGQTGQE